jgi:hypothetical protein
MIGQQRQQRWLVQLLLLLLLWGWRLKGCG